MLSTNVWLGGLDVEFGGFVSFFLLASRKKIRIGFLCTIGANSCVLRWVNNFLFFSHDIGAVNLTCPWT